MDWVMLDACIRILDGFKFCSAESSILYLFLKLRCGDVKSKWLNNVKPRFSVN
jgi:hypothetical protein